MFNWKNKLLSSLDLKKQNKLLNKNKTVEVGKLISKRILSRDEDTGSYIGGKLTISDNPFTEDDRKNYGKKLSERMRDKSDEPVEVQLPSTAIANARFDEDKGKIFVTFVGGDKEYVFTGNRKTWLDFQNSGSKGRFVNYILKNFNRAPESWWS